MTAPRDRWHRLAGAVHDSNLPASDKAVFRYLLDKADYVTAALPPKFTPNQAGIARQTSHRLRQGKYAVGHLRRLGWLWTEGRTGPGRTLTYTLALGAGCNCAGRVHQSEPEPERVQPGPPTGATFGYRTGATNGCNAAGQVPNHTERALRGVVEGTVERECSVPGCGEPARLYPGGWRCEEHKPRPFSAETGTMRRAAP